MDITDRLDILDLISRYGHCYDEGDLDAMADCFTADATFEIRGGIAGMPAVMEGREAIRQAMGARRASTATAQRRHLITNAIVDADGPHRARTASYLLLGSTVEGSLHLPVTGRYADVVVRDGGRWRFAERVLTMDGAIA
ncbi:nuclear transport factor 2 family protein [Euzebya sp.]|uniref:nuclear transport factor 2 family protein n=1 Tax=Euzebya sp. TaxID=1971409 RepID=UPI003514C112